MPITDRVKLRPNVFKPFLALVFCLSITSSALSAEKNYVANFSGNETTQIVIPDSESIRMADGMTVSFRFRSNVANGNILGKAGEYYFTVIDKKLYAYTNPGEVWLSASTDIDLGKWHHVATTVSYNDAESSYQMTLYVDGVASATSQVYKYGEFNSAQEPLIIGSYMRLEPFYLGALDDVCVYHRVLDKLEIRQLMLNGPLVTDSSLGVYLNFDAQNLMDSTAHAHLAKANPQISYTIRL